MAEAALYRLMAWLSPSYPVGGYSFSHGLEYAVEAGLVTDRDTLADWIDAILAHGAGQVDGVLFAAAWRAARADDRDELRQVCELARAFRATAEMALESLAQGDAFAAVTLAAWKSPTLAVLRATPPPSYPVAVAVACADAHIALDDSLRAYLQALAANLVGAGVRLVPLGQTDGQRIVAGLAPAVAAAADRAMATSLDEIGTAALTVDWCSMRHETQRTRLFRS